jgi:twitching motility protein PilT
MHAVLDQVLAVAQQLGASDVHLKVGLPPVFRIQGKLRTVRDVPPLSGELLGVFASSLMNQRQRAEFERSYDVDVGYGAPDGCRYRINIFQQLGHLGMVMRLIPPEVPAFSSLNLPAVVLRLAQETNGLVLVTGVTGSGKSTTLAAMIDDINVRRSCHILTVEDPVEYVFRDRQSVVNQRELGADTVSYAQALRAGLRQDPDVILVGEMRDRETMETALTAAETGHLVLSTLHTVDTVETINRIVAAFPPHQQLQVRYQLAAVLRGVVSQRLLSRIDQRGMVPAVEILVATARVRELVQDPARTRELHSVIAEGRVPYGMVSFDQSLIELVQRGLVAYEEAIRYATNADDFALHFRGVSSGAEPIWKAPQTHGQSGPGPTAEPQVASDEDGLAIERFSK